MEVAVRDKGSDPLLLYTSKGLKGTPAGFDLSTKGKKTLLSHPKTPVSFIALEKNQIAMTMLN